MTTRCNGIIITKRENGFHFNVDGMTFFTKTLALAVWGCLGCPSTVPRLAKPE